MTKVKLIHLLKYVSLFLLLIILTSFCLFKPSNVSAAGASLSFEPKSVSLDVGQTTTVNIVIDTGGEKAVGADALITYDPKVVAVTKVETGNIFADYPLATFDNTVGKVSLSGIVSSANDLYTGSGVLGKLTLQAVSAGTTTMKYDFTKGSTTDSNIAVTTGNGDALSSVDSLELTVTGAAPISVVPTVPQTSAFVAETDNTQNQTLLDTVLAILGIKKSNVKPTPTLDPYGPIPSQAPNTNPNSLQQHEQNLTNSNIQMYRYIIVAFMVLVVLIVAYVIIRRRLKGGKKQDGSATVVNEVNQNTSSGGVGGTTTPNDTNK